MKITEKDIFKYVLFPNELDPVKNKYICENENLFSDRIEYYKYFTEIFNDNNLEGEIKKTVDKIISKLSVVELFPMKNNKPNKSNTLTLAAATKDVAKKMSESITYSDEDSKYLVRVIKNKNQNILYVFPKNDIEDQKLKITLIPSMSIFQIAGGIKQIEIPPQKVIEKILIEKE